MLLGSRSVTRRNRPHPHQVRWERPHQVARISAAQQGREIGDSLNDSVRLEAQFFWNFSGTTLDPERIQPGGRGTVDIPGIRRNESQLRIRHLHALGSEIVNARL